ncbi:MAG: hypothetical protein ABEH56_02950 [Salinirussus sp.]
MRGSLTRLLLAAAVLPHEAAHALPAHLAGLDVAVTLLPEWDGPEVPLGQFNAHLDRETSLWLVRLIALAPLPTYLGVAAGLGAVLPDRSPATVLLLPALTYWATLSGGDFAVAAHPRSAREAGEFVAPRASWGDRLALALVPPNTLLVAVFLVT